MEKSCEIHVIECVDTADTCSATTLNLQDSDTRKKSRPEANVSVNPRPEWILKDAGVSNRSAETNRKILNLP